MKTKWSHNSILSDKARGLLFQKMLVGSIIVTLMAAFLPAPNVFAAPASDGDPTENNSLELEWSNKTRHVRFENLFYSRIRLLPSDFEDPNDLAQAYELVHKYGFALKQADEIILNHTGFDKKGHVINEIQADQSVKDLAMYLHIVHGLRTKLEEGEYEIRLLR